MVIVIILIGLVCAFEFVNGFHDTANAVATVIYTKTLKPKTAVLYSAVMNFVGIVVSTSIGLGVAYKIYNLLPWASIQSSSIGNIGIVMVVAIVMSALIRNLVTWWFKIPSSSTHALIASIVGAGIALAQLDNITINPFDSALSAILLSLIISPAIGAVLGYGCYKLSKIFIHNKSVFHSPHKHSIAPTWVRHLLIFTCGFVSFSHGANDGQKGLGMIMIVLTVTGVLGFQDGFVIPLWAIVLIPTVLGAGTMIGRKRIVKTIGEKIGTHDMTYAQGASAELVAASTIGIASLRGLPVSTTHVLSSAVMGTMATHKADSINWITIKHIGVTWILTIPICGVMSFGLVILLSLMI